MMNVVFFESNKIQAGYVTTPCSCGWLEQWPQEMKPQPKVYNTVIVKLQIRSHSGQNVENGMHY